MELRAGEGGMDSKLFTKDLAVAFVRFAALKQLKAEFVEEQEGSVSIKVNGPKALELFQPEAGKHCVQRVPPTEAKGRRHTSMITVAIVPMLITEDTFDPSDIDIKTQGGHGPGGQHQNKTDSAVRAVHKPTGTVVFINGRSQHQNKADAIAILQSKLAQMEIEKAQEAVHNVRSGQIDSGGRSGKVRTYNFINGLFVNHVNGTKTSAVRKVMNGNLDLLR